MAGQAELISLATFQLAVSILGLAFAHQFVTRIVATETTLAAQRGVHPDHGRVFAVADLTFKCLGS